MHSLGTPISAGRSPGRAATSFAKFDGAVGGLSTVLGVISAVLGYVLMGVIIADVVTRLITGSSLVGAFELAETILVLIVFFGISYVERTNNNVQVTLVTNRLPRKLAHGVRAFASLVSLLIVAWFAIATINLAVESVGIFEYEAGLINFPLWPARIAIALGFVVLVLEFATKIVKEVMLMLEAPQLGEAHDSGDDSLMANREKGLV